LSSFIILFLVPIFSLLFFRFLLSSCRHFRFYLLFFLSSLCCFLIFLFFFFFSTPSFFLSSLSFRPPFLPVLSVFLLIPFLFFLSTPSFFLSLLSFLPPFLPVLPVFLPIPFLFFFSTPSFFLSSRSFLPPFLPVRSVFLPHLPFLFFFDSYFLPVVTFVSAFFSSCPLCVSSSSFSLLFSTPSFFLSLLSFLPPFLPVLSVFLHLPFLSYFRLLLSSCRHFRFCLLFFLSSLCFFHIFLTKHQSADDVYETVAVYLENKQTHTCLVGEACSTVLVLHAITTARRRCVSGVSNVYFMYIFI